MARPARLDAPCALHHIIVRSIEHRKIFDDNGDQDNRWFGKAANFGPIARKSSSHKRTENCRRSGIKAHKKN